MIVCRLCGRKNSGNETHCKRCGAWLIDHGKVVKRGESLKRAGRLLKTAFGTMAVVVAVLALLGLQGKTKLRRELPAKIPGGVLREGSTLNATIKNDPPLGARLEVVDRSISVVANKVKVYGQIKNTGDESLHDVTITLVALGDNYSPIKKASTQLQSPIDPDQIQPFYVSLELENPKMMKQWTLETNSKYWY